MVLDTYDRERDVLIFKNTYDDPNVGLTKKFEIERTDSNAPRELYFVHIEIRDMLNLPSQNEREANKRRQATTRNESHIQAMDPNRKRSGESTSKSENSKTAKLQA